MKVKHNKIIMNRTDRHRAKAYSTLAEYLNRVHVWLEGNSHDRRIAKRFLNNMLEQSK